MKVERANTILYCSNWSATVAFYRDVLGFPVSADRGWFVEFQLAADAFVSVADASRATIASANGAGITLTWQVADVEAARDTLVERGVDCSPIAQRWGCDSTFFTDPEGNRVELWTTAD